MIYLALCNLAEARQEFSFIIGESEKSHVVNYQTARLSSEPFESQAANLILYRAGAGMQMASHVLVLDR